MMCLWLRGKNDLKKRFPHNNWPIFIILIPAISYTSYIMFTPSIYQFIVTPALPPEDAEDNKNSERLWPGLGGTERDYAWVITSFAIFETALFPVATIMLDTLPFTPSLLLMIVLFGVSGVVYASATEVWMVILARGIMGVASLLGSSITQTYVGEMSTILDTSREEKGQRPLKPIVYLFHLFSINGVQVLLLGINAGLVRIPSVNPYHLPGWVLAAMAILSMIIVLLFFSEPRPWALRVKCNRCSCRTGNGLSFKLKSKGKTRVMITVFIFACAYVNGQTYSVIYTLVSPILSDQFGFNVDNTALYFFGIAVGALAATIVQLTVKLMKGSSRIIIVLALSMCLVGCVLISDWQAIGGRTCFNHRTDANESYYKELFFTISNTTDNSTVSHILEEMCKAQSTSSHHCFWNPHSRITGDYCNTCVKKCLSYETSLNFYQFNVGVFLVMSGSILEFVFNLVLVSEMFPAQKQGRFIPLAVGFGALGRAISPYWFVESYEMTDRHTYLPMSITIGCLLVLLLCLVALYKELAPRVIRSEVKEATNAASQDMYISAVTTIPRIKEELLHCKQYYLLVPYEKSLIQCYQLQCSGLAVESAVSM